MSTATYREAADQLGVSLSTIQRRVKETAVPTWLEKGKVHFDLETLIDAWEQHLEASRPRGSELVAMTVSVRPGQRQAIMAQVTPERSISAVVRGMLDDGMLYTSLKY